ncbi:UNVERIFIED_CONTAM: hypothetical protein FKN15_027481 [Acipenser sinensis]
MAHMVTSILSSANLSPKMMLPIWQNRNESTNFNQKHVEELIKEEKRKEIESEIRVQVDELMREELKNLRLAVDRHSGTKEKGGIKKNGGVITSALNLSSLTKISDGYTQGHIMKAVKAVLTERRIDQLAKKPLTGVEYVVHLAKIDPEFKEEVEAFKAK